MLVSLPYLGSAIKCTNTLWLFQNFQNRIESWKIASQRAKKEGKARDGRIKGYRFFSISQNLKEPADGSEVLRLTYPPKLRSRPSFFRKPKMISMVIRIATKPNDPRI